MTLGQRLADAIERSVRGPMWHGPALADLVGDISADQAQERPLSGAHSIWELVLHITAWTEIVRARLTSASPVEPTAEQDWPPMVDRSADGWRAAVERMKDAHRELAEDVAALDEARLKALVPGRDHRIAVMLQGIVEHDAYHGGQIAILKKGLNEARTSPGP